MPCRPCLGTNMKTDQHEDVYSLDLENPQLPLKGMDHWSGLCEPGAQEAKTCGMAFKKELFSGARGLCAQSGFPLGSSFASSKYIIFYAVQISGTEEGGYPMPCFAWERLMVPACVIAMMWPCITLLKVYNHGHTGSGKGKYQWVEKVGIKLFR